MERHWIDMPQHRALRNAAAKLIRTREYCQALAGAPPARTRRCAALLVARDVRFREAWAQQGMSFLAPYLQFLCAQRKE
ncbi:MAG TPA: hypothetical protein VEB22_04280 [Phycisphaerales bacterium]|nr:hypothetical protein [Phycisphaerales bacterium]